MFFACVQEIDANGFQSLTVLDPRLKNERGKLRAAEHSECRAECCGLGTMIDDTTTPDMRDYERFARPCWLLLDFVQGHLAATCVASAVGILGERPSISRDYSAPLRGSGLPCSTRIPASVWRVSWSFDETPQIEHPTVPSFPPP